MKIIVFSESDYNFSAKLSKLCDLDSVHLIFFNNFDSLKKFKNKKNILLIIDFNDYYDRLDFVINSIKDIYDDLCEFLCEKNLIEEEDISNSELEEEEEEISKNSKDTNYEISESNQSMESIFIELNNLIGISNVKKRLTEIVNLIQIQKESNYQRSYFKDFGWNT